MPGIARQGDADNFGHTIQGGVSSNVKINNLPVAVLGSTMDDGAVINGGTISTILVNGIPAAVKGSTTTPHPQNPGRNSPGTIVGCSNDVGG